MKLRLLESTQMTDEELKVFIQEHCQPFLTSVGSDYDMMLYRGLDSNHYGGTYDEPEISNSIGKVRSDRRPMNSSVLVTEVLNQVIAEHGLVANRTNSMFCTGNAAMARLYGLVFIAIPIGEFNYTWATNAKDWYNKLKEYSEASTRAKRNVRDRMFTQFLDFVDRELVPISAEENERALALTPDQQLAYADSIIKNTLYDVLKEGLLGIRGDDGSLTTAISSGNEIMVKCNSVLYIRPAQFSRITSNETTTD